ncbi:hypothetical protein LO80_05380 [Candidatus Francisella endociliophora]|uniref:2'-5' RNA ligase n=1 Tax=Candidatus Francisella endociliophora TaxID=653937 RepID=A0A097EPF7_9GAMM|nr:hypothetical protein [Francisella sp. FSC1006]AIT09452.1 hypothetical protein LO80_05380 [Francisella sp. FSC1006]
MKVLKYLFLLILLIGLTSCKSDYISQEVQPKNTTNQVQKNSNTKVDLASITDQNKKYKGDFCVWLIPDNKNYKVLEDVIKDIANTQKSSSFKPHLTLFCGNNKNLPSLEKQFENTFKNEKIFSIDIGKPQMGERFSNKLYLPVEDNGTLEKFFLKAQKLDGGSEYAFDPHISVFYGEKIPYSIIDIPKKYLYMLDNPKVQKVALISNECASENYTCTRNIIKSIKLS